MNGSSSYTSLKSFCRHQKEQEIQIEAFEFCSKIEDFVEEQFFAILLKINSRLLDSYKNAMIFPDAPPELQIPTESEEVQLQTILVLMFGLNLLDRITTKRHEENLTAKNVEDKSVAKNKQHEKLIDASELIRGKVNVLFEKRQKKFKESNFSKMVQSTSKALRPLGFAMITFKHISIDFGEENNEMIAGFVSEAKSLLKAISEKEITELKELKRERVKKFAKENANKTAEKSAQVMDVNETSKNQIEVQNKDVDGNNNEMRHENDKMSNDFTENKVNFNVLNQCMGDVAGKSEKTDTINTKTYQTDRGKEDIKRLSKGKGQMESEDSNYTVVDDANGHKATKEIECEKKIGKNGDRREKKQNVKMNKQLKKSNEKLKEKNQFGMFKKF